MRRGEIPSFVHTKRKERKEKKEEKRKKKRKKKKRKEKRRVEKEDEEEEERRESEREGEYDVEIVTNCGVSPAHRNEERVSDCVFTQANSSCTKIIEPFILMSC